MRRSARSLCVFSLLLCSFAVLPLPGAAQDGPIRQRLKERWLQRHQNTAATGTAADAGTHDDAKDSDNAKITKPGDYSFTLRHDGLARMYQVHVPASYRPARPAPLLVILHGGGGSMDYQADDSRYGEIAKSEQQGFVAVFPNGYSKLGSGKFATWNAGKCCGGARDNQADDVGFIRAMVDRITGQMNIDRNRIYATGMSNGGMMSYRLACEMSDVFKAIAPVAGTDNTLTCHPKNPVAVLHIHARNDDHVLFDGGAGPGVPKQSAVNDFTSVPATVAKWVELDSCAATPKRILDKAGAYCDVYAPCGGKAEVQLCVTETGGHSWPGAPKTRGQPASQAISANDIMWDFFNRH